MRYVFLLFLIPIKSFAWFCEEASSERTESVIHACGIGINRSESEARTLAFDDAKREFTKVCKDSSGCDPQMISVSPMRTDCSFDGLEYKCYRLLDFSLVKATSVESPESATGKLKKGLAKSSVLGLFGEPSYVAETMNQGLLFGYRDKKFCLNEDTCTVIFRNGKADYISGFKSEVLEY